MSIIGSSDVFDVFKYLYPNTDPDLEGNCVRIQYGFETLVVILYSPVKRDVHCPWHVVFFGYMPVFFFIVLIFFC